MYKVRKREFVQKGKLKCSCCFWFIIIKSNCCRYKRLVVPRCPDLPL